MKYREYGDTDHHISQLGFGAMRLPENGEGGIDKDAAVRLLREAHHCGINYYDTAYVYNGGESEKVLGEAMADCRDDIYISTKIPIHTNSTDVSCWRELMEEQLDRLQTDYIDFWHFHDLKYPDFQEYVAEEGELLQIVRQAREEGLVRHICVSCHEPPEKMLNILKTGYFEGVLLQYNLLDRDNERVIDYCQKEGIGVVVMGPVGGGQLARPSRRFAEMSPEEVSSLPELAIRYVLSNQGVDCALSGMNSMDMLHENVAAASSSSPLSDEEVRQIEERTRELDRLADLYCTGCGYCMPCPEGVNIPKNFKLMNDYRVYGFEEGAKQDYAAMPTSDEADSGLRASECIECGACVDKCPQDINIPEQLREVDAALSE